MDQKTKSLTEVKNQLEIAKMELGGDAKLKRKLDVISNRAADEKKKFLQNQNSIKKIDAKEKLEKWNSKWKDSQDKVINGVLKKGLNGWIGKHKVKVANFKHDLRKKFRKSISLDSKIDRTLQNTEKQYLKMGGLYKKIKNSVQ